MAVLSSLFPLIHQPPPPPPLFSLFLGFDSNKEDDAIESSISILLNIFFRGGGAGETESTAKEGHQKQKQRHTDQENRK